MDAIPPGIYFWPRRGGERNAERAAGGGVGERGGRISGGREGMRGVAGSLVVGLGRGRTKRGGWSVGGVASCGGAGKGSSFESSIVGWRGEVGVEVGSGGEEDMVMGSVSTGLRRRRFDDG